MIVFLSTTEMSILRHQTIFIQCMIQNRIPAESVGVEEYTDYISAER